MDINVSKIMKERGVGQVGELGDNEGVGVVEKYFFTWLSRPPSVLECDLTIIRPDMAK